MEQGSVALHPMPAEGVKNTQISFGKARARVLRPKALADV